MHRESEDPLCSRVKIWKEHRGFMALKICYAFLGDGLVYTAVMIRPSTRSTAAT